MDRPLQGQAYDLSAVAGRIVARLRAELGITQIELAERVQFERGLLVRLETGKTTVNLYHLHALEVLFVRAGFLSQVGELSLLSARVGGRLKSRGATPDRGVTARPEGLVSVEAAVVDRVVAVVVDEWLRERRAVRDLGFI